MKRNNPVHYNANLYTPNLDWSTFNVIDDKKRDFSFKNVMKVFALMNDKMIDLSLLNCDSQEEYIAIYQWLNVQRWQSNNSNIYDGFTQEEIDELFKAEQTFDYLKDYDAYWCDFMTIGIDLETSDIDFIRFCWLLENKFMCDEKSAISNRIRMRTYEYSKNDSIKYRTHMTKLKNKYALYEDKYKALRIYNNLKKGGE